MVFSSPAPKRFRLRDGSNGTEYESCMELMKRLLDQRQEKVIASWAPEAAHESRSDIMKQAWADPNHARRRS
jgi:hypothetical protein